MLTSQKTEWRTTSENRLELLETETKEELARALKKIAEMEEKWRNEWTKSWWTGAKILKRRTQSCRKNCQERAERFCRNTLPH